MREVSEVKEMLRIVSDGMSGINAAKSPLIRWSKYSPPRFKHRYSFSTSGEFFSSTEQEMEDLSAADIAKEALHTIEQLEGPRLALEQRNEELERDLAAERAFIKRLLQEVRR